MVEDYAPLRAGIVQALREEGYSVDETYDGEDGWTMASRGQYDVLVLDLMLPRLDGLEVLRRLRRSGSSAGVLLLTARDTIADRVDGLDAGADDYLVKPFAIEELLARVRALVRRGYAKRDPLIEVGHLRIHTTSHRVEVDGEAVEFTAKEYALLEYLAQRKGEVVSRTDIWQHIYDDRSEATSNVVDVYIGYLRKKIEREGHSRLLRTRRGEGYVLSDDG